MHSAKPVMTPPTIDIDGRAYRWSRLRLRDYVELEQRYAAARPDPIEVARRCLLDLPEMLQRHVLGLAFDEAMCPTSPTVEELRRWLLGSKGMSLALELSLRVEHSNITAEQCRRAVYEAEGERRCELLRVIAAATGVLLCEELPSDTAEPEWIGEPYATD